MTTANNLNLIKDDCIYITEEQACVWNEIDLKRREFYQYEQTEMVGIWQWKKPLCQYAREAGWKTDSVREELQAHNQSSWIKKTWNWLFTDIFRKKAWLSYQLCKAQFRALCPAFAIPTTDAQALTANIKEQLCKLAPSQLSHLQLSFYQAHASSFLQKWLSSFNHLLQDFWQIFQKKTTDMASYTIKQHKIGEHKKMHPMAHRLYSAKLPLVKKPSLTVLTLDSKEYTEAYVIYVHLCNFLEYKPGTVSIKAITAHLSELQKKVEKTELRNGKTEIISILQNYQMLVKDNPKLLCLTDPITEPKPYTEELKAACTVKANRDNCQKVQNYLNAIPLTFANSYRLAEHCGAVGISWENISENIIMLSQINSGFKKAALKVHPDQNGLPAEVPYACLDEDKENWKSSRKHHFQSLSADQDSCKKLFESHNNKPLAIPYEKLNEVQRLVIVKSHRLGDLRIKGALAWLALEKERIPFFNQEDEYHKKCVKLLRNEATLEEEKTIIAELEAIDINHLTPAENRLDVLYKNYYEILEEISRIYNYFESVDKKYPNCSFLMMPSQPVLALLPPANLDNKIVSKSTALDSKGVIDTTCKETKQDLKISMRTLQRIKPQTVKELCEKSRQELKKKEESHKETQRVLNISKEFLKQFFPESMERKDLLNQIARLEGEDKIPLEKIKELIEKFIEKHNTKMPSSQATSPPALQPVIKHM